MATKALPTPDVLRQLLSYDPDTGKLFWMERGPEWFSGTRRPEDSAKAWNSKNAFKEAGSVGPAGYVLVSIKPFRLYAHRIIWAMQNNFWPDGEIDHIDGCRTNNRKQNLRDVTAAENGRNKRQDRRNTSGFGGVYRYINNGWSARICHMGKQMHVGVFKTKKEAIKARKAAMDKYGYSDRHGAN